jgi:hypothetical protein
MGRMGRPSVFDPKDGTRYQGVMTKVGSKRFESARKELAALAGLKRVSDADVMEFLVRGRASTEAYLQAKERKAG